MLEAMMLGKAVIYWKGKRMLFPFAKMEALLYYLLLNRSVSRSELASLLWSDMPDDAAKKNLRNTLYLLKKLLGDELLVTPSRSVLVLNESLVAPTDVERLAEGPEQALEVYGGEFLADFVCRDAVLFEEWVIQTRERLREEHIQCLTQQILTLMKEKAYKKAQRYLRQLIAADEYNESAYRALMRIYEHEGEYNKAIDAYAQLENKLQTDLGIAPDQKTQDIVERIRQRKHVSSQPRPAAPEDVFFGRTQELAYLHKWLMETGASGKGKPLMVVYGEQGVGKSALVHALISRLPQAKERILRTECYQAELQYPYKAWGAVFARAAAYFQQQGAALPLLWRQVLSQLFPSALPEDILLAAPAFEGHSLQPTVVEEVLCALLGRLAERERLLLCIDDIQWMDQQGLILLQHILRQYPGRVICLATCRLEEKERLERALGAWQAKEALEWRVLPRFTQAEVASFAAMSLPAETLQPQLPRKLYEYSEGNALFLVECFKLLQMGQDIGRLSPRLHNVLKERISHVSDNGRKVLEAASAFVRDTRYEQLRAIVGLNEFELVEAIEELQEKKLLQESTPSAGQTLGYQFCHGRIRDFVYTQMSASRQKMLHYRIGADIEGDRVQGIVSRDRLHLLIYHYTQAGDALKVLEYQIQLAELYACPHYEMFPELGEDGGEGGEERWQMAQHLEQVGNLLAASKDKGIGEDKLGRCRAAYLEMLGRYHIWRGQHRQGVQEIHRLLRLAAEKEYPEYRLKGYQQIVYCGIQTRRPQLIAHFADKLIKQGNDAGRKAVLGTALRFKGLAYAMQCQPDLAEQYYRQSISWFRRIKDGQERYAAHIAAAYNYIGELRRGQQALDEALCYYETAIRLHGSRRGEGLVLCYINAGCTAFEQENYDLARRYLQEAVAIAEQFGGQMGYWCQRGQCTLNCVLALIAVREGRAAEGAAYLTQAEQFLLKYQDTYQQAIMLRSKTEIRRLMDSQPAVAEVFGALLPDSVAVYRSASQALFGRLGCRYELAMLDKER